MRKRTALCTVTAAGAMMLASFSANAQEIYPLAVATGNAYSSYYSEANSELLSEVTYPALYLMNGYEEMYPQLDQTLQAVNDLRAQMAGETYDNLAAYAEEDYPYFTGEYWVPYASNERIQIRRADTSLISLLFANTTDYGTGEMSYSFWGENYNTETGQLIPLSEVVADMAGFQDAVAEQMDFFWGYVEQYSDSAVYDYFASMDEWNLSWTLDYQGVTMYFNYGDLADAQFGTQAVTIPFDVYPELFTGAYQQVCPSYCVTLGSEQPFFYDFDLDGYQDSLYITGTPNEYYGYDNIQIFLNDVEFTDDMYGYSMDPVLVHLEDGGNYLYIQNLLDNDYRELRIYYLGGGTVEPLGALGLGLHGYPEFNGYYTKDALISPEGFYLDARSDVLGTCTGYRWYHIGEDGFPVPDEDSFTLNNEVDMTLIGTLEAEIVDWETGVTGEMITLYPGNVVRTVRTDLESYADLMLQDGTIVRVSVDVSEWPQTVNGVSIEEMFEGYMFAG